MGDPHDIASFGDYYRDRSPYTRRYIRWLLSGTGADWQDIHHEVWKKVFIKYFEPGFAVTTGLDQYLNGSLFRAAYDYLKNTKERPTDFDKHPELFADTSQSAIDHVIERLNGSAGTSDTTGIRFDLKNPASWDNRDLADAVEALSPRQRAVILFWAWAEPPPTNREIAEEFGITENTAKTHHRRALMKLRQVLGAPKVTEKEESN